MAARTDGSNCPQLLPSGSPARGCRLTTPWGRRCPSAGRPHVCSLAVLPCEAPPLRRTLETRIPASPAWSLGPSVSPTRGTARGCRTRAVLRRCKQGSQVAVVNCHGCPRSSRRHTWPPLPLLSRSAVPVDPALKLVAVRLVPDMPVGAHVLPHLVLVHESIVAHRARPRVALACSSTAELAGRCSNGTTSYVRR